MNLDELDVMLLTLRWTEAEIDGQRGVLIHRGNGDNFPMELAERLVDHGWQKIADRCQSQGYQFAKLCTQSEPGQEARSFVIPASFSAIHRATPQNPPDGYAALKLPENLSIQAFRLIPFFVGCSKVEPTAAYFGFPSLQLTDGHLICFDDGFAVYVLEDAVFARTVPEFLLHRRKSHLAVLSRSSPQLQTLLEYQAQCLKHPLLFSLPESLSYVMSVHAIDNRKSQVNEQTIRLITEPAILGITDEMGWIEPADSEYEISNSDILTLSDGQVRVVHSSTASIYSGWANVVVECKKSNQQAAEMLVKQEICLQKLWYKLMLLSDGLSMVESQIDALNASWLKQARRAVCKVKAEYSSFANASPTGSTIFHKLKEDLIATSKIETVYHRFLAKASLLDEIEKIL